MWFSNRFCSGSYHFILKWGWQYFLKKNCGAIKQNESEVENMISDFLAFSISSWLGYCFGFVGENSTINTNSWKTEQIIRNKRNSRLCLAVSWKQYLRVPTHFAWSHNVPWITKNNKERKRKRKPMNSEWKQLTLLQNIHARWQVSCCLPTLRCSCNWLCSLFIVIFITYQHCIHHLFLLEGPTLGQRQ